VSLTNKISFQQDTDSSQVWEKKKSRENMLEEIKSMEQLTYVTIDFFLSWLKNQLFSPDA
jgi:hypothetical protein